MRTIAIINQKGGCGKTTSAINVAAGFARRGFRTLLVDLDPQAHCAAGLGVPEDRMDLDVADALRAGENAPLDRDRLLWRIGRGFDLLPSRMKLAGLEAARGGLADMDNPQNRLATVIDRLTRDPAPNSAEHDVAANAGHLRRYDAVVIDCPPSIGLLSYNALAAASEVLIPVETSFFSLRGAGKQIQTARSVVRHVGAEARIRLLATMYDPALPLARDLLDDLRDRFGAAVIPTVIRLDPEVKEAASFGRPVEDHAPGSMGAGDYGSLCEWLIEHAALERPEPGTDERGPDTPASSTSEPTLADPSAPPAAPTMSRAQEMALKAATMTAARPQTGPPRRSLMPHRAVAIELIEDPPDPVAPAEAGEIRHLWGCRPVAGGLLLVHPCAGVRSVAVAGSFNGWNPDRGQMTRRDELGIFERRIDAPPGRYEYRLVIDGVWQCDPYNPARVGNGLGGENNLAVVT
tara:strand:- start:2934 stop:4322 length:1389 start_codon:yes stop_codon:yes gene_type:complete